VPKFHIVPTINILVSKKPEFKLVFGQWLLMTHDRKRSMFLDLKPIEEGTIAFGGMGKGNITSISKIGIHSLASIDNVLYVRSKV